MKIRVKTIFHAMLALLLSAVALADEGMWTLDNFPHAAVQEKYGVEITDDWLQTVKRSVARLDGGCSASFISANGLLLTNHHCAISCIAQNSSADNDLEASGFVARTEDEELRCAADRVSVLMETEEITTRVVDAVGRKTGKEAGDARRRVLKRIVEECEQTSDLKCESVSLYQGGQYWLYKFNRYDDVRLVFAPESDIASFGGDPDNFNFPRWSLDMTLLRVYRNGEPLATPDFLRWRSKGLKPGEVMFVAGRPGSSQRLLTVADLKFLRDVTVPQWLIRASELRGRYIQFAESGDEANRIVQVPLQRVENGIKVLRKRLDALHNDQMMADKIAAERRLKAQIATRPELAREVGSAWDDIRVANETYANFRDEYYFIELGYAFSGRLFGYARALIRAATERAKPNALRLDEYTVDKMPRRQQLTLAARPIYPELEILQLSFSLDKMREYLGPDSAYVREILGAKAPRAIAEELVTGTELADPELRARLWEADLAELEASEDPMIQLALAVDDEARALRKRYEDEVEAPSDLAYEKIANARFAIEGSSSYPDATFTLRVSYGAHEGWVEKGEPVRPYTTLAELYPRVTGQPPFKLPASWSDAEKTLPADTKFNFVGTTDVIGGNSGSPVIDSAGRLVGLVFDGNIHSISGAYWFDAERNRTVNVHPEIMLEALDKLYDADHLVDELTLVD
ncbi:MAG: S46 family peptidase [Gammaproteobacteria bacterium]|nr:S46 family peptidase [Gammaproteobacteria bacterium]